MANEEHLAILRQGVTVWNKWRKENYGITPDLSEADLKRLNLSGADLSNADLRQANLAYTNLVGVNLNQADLGWVVAQGADFSNANITEAKLHEADFTDTKLNGASVVWTTIVNTKLNGANFSSVIFSDTILSEVDLSEAKNLESAIHYNPSSISIDTILISKGKIPIEFLEGCGVPKHVIENMQYLVDIPTIQYYSCFISYSTKDDEFAHQLNDRMKREGLRVWFAPEEMKGGQKIHEQLYEAIRYHDKLILVLSEASMNSNWVQSEIRRARKHEREDKRRKLFPISLVPFGDIQKWELFEADEGVDLAREIREYYIPDFCQWKDYDKFNAEFDKLLKALRAEE